MKDFLKYNKTYIITGILIIAIVITSFIIYNKLSNKNEPQKIIQDKEEYSVEKNLVLFGANTISLNYNDKYQEPGYYAINEKGELETKLVKVQENIDTTKPGTYTITYKYDDIERTRTIIVLEKENDNEKEEQHQQQETPTPSEKEPNKYDANLLKISLKGSQTIKLNTEESFVEPGYTASYNNINLNNNVLVTSNYIQGKPGNYTVTYTINYNGIQKQIIRGIIVISSNLNISLTNTTNSFTKNYVTIKVVTNGSSLSSIKLPNGKTTTSKNFTYKVSKNGTYTFTAYNTSNKEFKKSITINNIDKESPTGTCEATLNNNNTVIKVNAKDAISGINNYVYKDSNNNLTTLFTNTYTHNKNTSKNISVQVTDKVGNYTNISCKIIDKSYLPVIKPEANENLIKQEETDSLKIYITKKNNYYVTRIWMIDPYNQINKEDSPNYGSKLYKPSTLLQNAMNLYGYQNKLLVGFNASGFYLKNTYDAESVNKYSRYDKTSVGTLVITNGKVIRNVYDKAYKTWYTIGIDSNNTLRIFEDLKTTNIDEKKKWSQNVISSGIKNTFTFASPLIQNGKRSSITTSMPSPNSKKNRQAICQVNQNNFILITGKELTRGNLIDIMSNLKCQTGTNLDGGSSIALLFKSSSSNQIETIIGNSRELTEVGYFAEK